MRRADRKKRDSIAPRPAGRSFTSTEAQNNFGQVLSQASREGRVFITRYDRPEAVVLSIEEYESLTERAPVDLEALEREFDAMLEEMQGPPQRAAVDELFALRGRRLKLQARSASAEE